MPEVIDGMDEATAWATLDQKFPLSAQAWRDVMQLDPDSRVQAFRDMLALGGLSWARETSTIDDVEAVLNFLANIANPISAIAGGVTGVAGVVSVLRGH